MKEKPPTTSLRFDSENQKQLWQKIAKSEGRSLANWIKRVCDIAAEKKLKESSPDEQTGPKT